MEALVKSCKIFVGCDRACPVCPNNKELRFPKRVELFYLFLAFSYRSMEARALSCSFTWVLYGMPKVTNYQYLSKELSDFVDFLHVVSCVLLDIY